VFVRRHHEPLRESLPIEVAFTEEPWRIEPLQLTAILLLPLLQLMVVLFDVGEAIVGQRCKLPIVL
jgi:hypothetical protein